MPAGNSGEAKCECWFLDVGQGSANVILLGGGKAIVVDCGPVGANQARQLLKALSIDTIEALVITHNDNDHDGHAAAIIEAYPNAIKDIYLLADRNAEEISLRKTLARIMQNEKREYPVPKRLEADGDAPRILFSENDVTLKVIYPDLPAALKAEMSASRRANLTSAILQLSCGERKIVFSGDAPIESWELLSARIIAKKPLACDVMTIPHHGGKISNNDEPACQQRLYSEIIRPIYGIVSVGSNNTFGHPLAECISALRQAGVKVLCTQMTPQCCENIENIRTLRRTISRPARSTREENRSSTGRSRHVACFGSVVAEVSPQKVRISNLVTFEQDRASFGQVLGFTPICEPLN
jgi:competence protein ComEC